MAKPNRPALKSAAAPGAAVLPPPGAAPQTPPAAADAPQCPYHHTPCQRESGSGFFSYWHCTVETCSYTTKRPHPQLAPRLRRERDQGGDFSAR